jgi:hypothetical protein
MTNVNSGKLCRRCACRRGRSDRHQRRRIPPHCGRLYYIGVGWTHGRTHVITLVSDLMFRAINATTGELPRQLTLPTGPVHASLRPTASGFGMQIWSSWRAISRDVSALDDRSYVTGWTRRTQLLRTRSRISRTCCRACRASCSEACLGAASGGAAAARQHKEHRTPSRPEPGQAASSNWLPLHARRRAPRLDRGALPLRRDPGRPEDIPAGSPPRRPSEIRAGHRVAV